MGRPHAQHRIGRYRFTDIDKKGDPVPLGLRSGITEDKLFRVESVCSERVYALRAIPLEHKTWQQKQLLSEHLSRGLVGQRELRHPHIVQLQNLFLSEHQLCAVLDWASAGSLADYASKHRDETPQARFTDSIRWFFQQLVFVLDYLHQKQPGVIQDIRLQDLLLTATDKTGQKLSRPLLKVSLFKLSKFDPDRRSPHPWISEIDEYDSPEQRHNDADSLSSAVADSPIDAAKVNVWKAGVILWTLLTGDTLDTSDAEEIEEDLQDLPDGDAADLLRQMLHSDPSQRVDLEGIMQHAWFVRGLPPGALELTDQMMAAEPLCCCSQAQVEEIVQEALDIVGCGGDGDSDSQSDSEDTAC